jgi:hypothetical protein
MFLDSGRQPGWPNFRLRRPARIRVAVGLPGVTLAVGMLILIALALPQPPSPGPNPLSGPVLVHHDRSNPGLLYIDTR